MRDLIKTCFVDLEDDVWRTLSDPPHGPVLHLHRRHLQRVLQQRPQCVRLGVARWAHVPKEHLEVRTKPSLFFPLEISAQWLLFVLFSMSVFCFIAASSSSVLAGSPFLAINPTEPGAFTGPYPFGIDPVWTSPPIPQTFCSTRALCLRV